ncbi:MAG: CbtB-domain containing protein [Proteobacteria bacterium]|nr:MAG: CbtB-domain containing protein [Pseudomonadota bacterium]
MSAQTLSSHRVIPRTAIAQWVQIMGALAFGATIIFIVGFAPMDVVHNAAHDTRHTAAFPCH